MMATRTPSPAQLAARARFAEMARNGSLNRKRQIAAKKRSTNPALTSNAALAKWIDKIAMGETYSESKLKEALDHPGVTTAHKAVIRAALKGAPYSHFDMLEVAIDIRDFAKTQRELAKLRKANPRKKTVSQKISQLVHEGYPQKQAVAVALNEQRVGKVKRNPTSGMVKGFAVVCMHPKPHTVAITTSMAEAKKIGQDYATRENVQVAIKPVDVHASHFA